MEASRKGKKPSPSFAAQMALCIGALGIMVALMYYSIIYPYPDGKSLDVVGFVELWLREIILLAFVVIGLFVGITAWLVRFIRRMRNGGKNAP